MGKYILTDLELVEFVMDIYNRQELLQELLFDYIDKHLDLHEKEHETLATILAAGVGNLRNLSDEMRIKYASIAGFMMERTSNYGGL